ncbi:MAG: chromophore lyase CpcT/CpeT [Gammaproteobacteria bacterium]
MKLHHRLLTCCLVLTLTQATVVAQERSFTLLERELEYLVAIWPGDYDNREQLGFDASVGKKDMDSGGHLRVHSQIRRVEVPALGDYVLYVEEYKDNDPASIFRQRLYVLSADEEEKAVRLKLMFFKDGKSFLGAHNDTARLAGLANDSVSSLEGCDVFIRRDGNWLAGSMKPKTCIFGEEDKRRYSDYQLRVAPGQYWFRDRTLNLATDQPMEQVADFSWHQLEQARWFSCMIDFPRKSGGPPVVTHHYVEMHDQGGTFPFTHPDGRDMVLTMRNNWSYGMQRETFVIVVQQGNESGPTLVYAWGNPGADRIGVNPGYLRVQCDLNTPQQVQLQHRLRPDS